MHCDLKRFTFLWLTLFFPTLWAQCIPKNDTKGYPLPIMDLDSFQTRIEFNDLVSRTTITIREWYQSYDSGAGRIDFLSAVVTQPLSYIFSFKTNETFLISGDNGVQTCQVLDINASDPNMLISIRVDKTGTHIASLAATLKFGLRYGLEFMGLSFVRGIETERWRSCMYLEERNANVTMDYHFSLRNWTTPTGFQVPLRAEIHGSYNDKSNRTIDEHYEFIDFIPSIIDDAKTIFQTPEGVLCEGRKFVKPIPRLPDILKYSQEIIQNVGSGDVQLSYNTIHYDYPMKLMRYDYHEYMPKPPLYNVGTVMLVHDFNTGVAYFVNKMAGNCTVRPIGQDMFDIKIKPGPNITGYYQIEMRNPNDYFRIDDKYTYEGQRTIRGGIPVDVYIAKRPNYKPPGWENDGRNFTFEYFVLDPDSIAINVGGVQIAQNIPLQLKVATYNAPGDQIDTGFLYQETTNFYNMDLSYGQGDLDEPQPSSFDVQSCYSNSQKKHVRFTFTGPPYSTIKKEPAEFIRQVIKLILSQIEGLSPLRIQDPQLDYDDKYVYFTATILDAAPFQAQFVKTTADKYWVSALNQRVYTDVKSSDDCLRNCSSTAVLFCNSTAYCPSTKTCVLSGGRTPLPDINKQNTGCQIYFRPVVDTIGSEASVSSILNMLDVDDFMNFLNVTLELENSVKVSYLAIDIRTNIYRPPGGSRTDVGGVNVEKFTVQVNSGMLSDRTVPGIQSADECAKQCLDSLQPSNCLSFTYCYDIGDCMLTVQTPSSLPNSVVPRARCDLFTQNSLAQFNHLPGKSLVRAATDKMITTETDLECANRCVKNGTDCLSFDLCPISIEGRSTFMCYMSKRHSTDSTGADLRDIDNCDHYSKLFSSDFSKISSVTNPTFPSSMKVYKGTISNVCARYCVDLHGDLCRGYYTCDDKCAILLVDDIMLEDGPDGQREDKNLYCDLMIRNFYPDGSSYIPRRLPSAGVPVNRFDLQRDSITNGDQVLLNVVSAESCSRTCLETTSPSCQAFSFCVDTLACFLSFKVPIANESVSQPRCDLYTRNSLSTYKEIVGKSLVEQNNPKQPVDSPSKCANECDSQGNKCRSFDACPFTTGGKDMFYCYYTDKHFNTNGGDIRNSKCTHYSKSFQKDFILRNKITNPTFPSSMVKYMNENEDRCAQNCVEYHGIGCQSYYYCNSTSMCIIQMINEAAIKSGPNSDTTMTCSFMDRAFFQDGSPYSPRIAQVTQNKGLNSGSVAALVVIMLALGVILCLVTIYFVYRRKLATTEANSPSFQNKTYESE